MDGVEEGVLGTLTGGTGFDGALGLNAGGGCTGLLFAACRLPRGQNATARMSTSATAPAAKMPTHAKGGMPPDEAAGLGN